MSLDDASALKHNLRAAHHTSTGIHGVVNRVCGNVSVVAFESNTNNNKIVDVIEVLANRFCCMSCSTVDNDQISRSTVICNLVGNMSGKNELSICPSNIHL